MAINPIQVFKCLNSECRRTSAVFCKTTKKILKDYFSSESDNYDFIQINRIVVLANHYRNISLTKNDKDFFEKNKPYAKYKGNLKRKYDLFKKALLDDGEILRDYNKIFQFKVDETGLSVDTANVVLDNGEIPRHFCNEFRYELGEAGLSVNTAIAVLDALEKAISDKTFILTRENKRPRKSDYYFNVPLGRLLSQSGLNRAESSRLIAEIRIATDTLISGKEDFDKLSKRIEQQLSNEEIKN
ncbi:MAG: hypothetical protein AB2794_20730 [Candidatus Thiodiazotropha endolucinida]